MAEKTTALATLTVANPQPSTVWDDDASTLASSRSSWSSEASLAKMGWKSRPRQSECRELLKSNRSLLRATPSIYVHSSRCTCKSGLDDKQKAEDDALALRILETLETHRMKIKENLQSQRRQKQSTNVIARFFASTPPPPPTAPAANSSKVLDLCFGCSSLDIDKVSRYLLHEGLSANARNHVGTTPLMAALRAMSPEQRPKSHLAMLTFLLGCGADPNATMDIGTNPTTNTTDDGGKMSIVAAAVSLNLPDAIVLLLRRGAAVDAPLNDVPMFRFIGKRMTALHVAAFADRPECMELLLQHGSANVAATFDLVENPEPVLPAPKAAPRTNRHSQPPNLNQKTSSSRNANPASKTSTSRTSRTPTPNLKPSKPSADTTPSKKDIQPRVTKNVTALHLAETSPSSARILLRHGASPLARDSRGQTPLHWAARSGDAAVVQQLLDAGAGPTADVMDRDGATPLAVLVERVEAGAPRNGDAEVVRLLLARGANADLKKNGGRSLRERLLECERRGVF
ncbi:ankyrin repeat-containing domain protein [Podospora appendiculata]|uniref:Ankyrin repeat-containing domain protein n=1 Tax=Podospora appendiculata TaxID=314037 RepID=A0AAE0XHM4_9PEZI|nr:ankyrin repeat-containing domain protein [Podospora appendiculata]